MNTFTLGRFLECALTNLSLADIVGRIKLSQRSKELLTFEVYHVRTAI
jgi:hypothetical protein